MSSHAAYQHNGVPCTREQFYAIACDPRRSVVVEACAGAGKTWMLVSRILRALLDGCAPHEILAITFTRKAAGEMRQRLLQWLGEFARPLPADAATGRPEETQQAWAQRLERELIARGIPPQAAHDKREQLRKLYETVLEHGRPVQFRTFHGWFATLLRSAPLAVLRELGLPPAYELLEDDQDAVAQVWRPFLQQVAQDPGLRADYAGLVSALGRHRTHTALEAALGRRTEFMLADAARSVEQSMEAFAARFPRLANLQYPAQALDGEDARQRWLARAKALGAEKNATPQKVADAVVDAFGCADLQERLKRLRAGFFVAKEDRLNKNLQKFAAAQEAELELQELLDAEFQHGAWLYHQRMTRLVRVLIECFAQLKRSRGWVDMNDVERAAMRLLGDHAVSAWVQERLDARIRHLLIDEFQDINPLQWQALHAWLSGYGGAGGGQGAPSVFIVGDPKQSIYRFRRAEPRVFVDAGNFVVQALGGERLATEHTRRNAPQVLAAVNDVMQAAQGAGEFAGYRAHTTESAGQGEVRALPFIVSPSKVEEDASAEPPWRDSLAVPRQSEEEKKRTLECRQAAQWIAGRIAAGVPPGQIMVLARRREPLSQLQLELRALGVACEQPDKSALGEQPAVLDVLALVDALISPGHDLMLARALRSPLFGLTDEDLTRMALAVRAAGEPRPAWLDVLSTVELEAHDGQALHADLMLYRQWLLQLPPHDALQAIYSHRDVPARFAAAAPVPERAQVVLQLRALLSAALQVHGGRFLTAYQWLRLVRREHLPMPRHASDDVVRLLTVHGAKGLEADEVLLLDSDYGRTPRGDAVVLLDWPADVAAPRKLVFLEKESAPAPGASDLAQQEAQAQAREELNALYVAMTRARSRLVLSGAETRGNVAGTWWKRVQPLSQPLEPPQTGAAAEPAAVADSFTMMELPAPVVTDDSFKENTAQALVQQGRAATQREALQDGLASRLGQAMHWLLEHTGDTPSGWLAERVVQLPGRFSINADQAAQADAMARRIFTGEAAWAWSRDALLQAFSEVELTHEGQRLRIDRLVQRRAGAGGAAAWWVLDYKSAAQPERDPALLEQMARYRQAVQALHPDAVVHAALLSGDGRMVAVA